MAAGNKLAPLFTFRCTIVEAAALSAPDPTNPQGGTTTGYDWDTPEASTADVPCRVAPVPLLTQMELEAVGVGGTAVSTHVVHIPYSNAPSTLIDFDASVHPTVNHRIEDVTDSTGATYLTGPLEILSIGDAGGGQEVVAMSVRAVN